MSSHAAAAVPPACRWAFACERPLHRTARSRACPALGTTQEQLLQGGRCSPTSGMAVLQRLQRACEASWTGFLLWCARRGPPGLVPPPLVAKQRPSERPPTCLRCLLTLHVDRHAAASRQAAWGWAAAPAAAAAAASTAPAPPPPLQAHWLQGRAVPAPLRHLLRARPPHPGEAAGRTRAAAAAGASRGRPKPALLGGCTTPTRMPLLAGQDRQLLCAERRHLRRQVGLCCSVQRHTAAARQRV